MRVVAYRVEHLSHPLTLRAITLAVCQRSTRCLTALFDLQHHGVTISTRAAAIDSMCGAVGAGAAL